MNIYFFDVRHILIEVSQNSHHSDIASVPHIVTTDTMRLDVSPLRDQVRAFTASDNVTWSKRIRAATASASPIIFIKNLDKYTSDGSVNPRLFLTHLPHRTRSLTVPVCLQKHTGMPLSISHTLPLIIPSRNPRHPCQDVCVETVR